MDKISIRPDTATPSEKERLEVIGAETVVRLTKIIVAGVCFCVAVITAAICFG